jgi:hypothetical protein
MKQSVFQWMGLCLVMTAGHASPVKSNEWVPLFDGKTLAGWRANENSETFSVQDGMIVAQGRRSHLFYVGPVANHNFTNFELKADVKTAPKANSGIYFHTRFQKTGWPEKGYEVQINNTHPGSGSYRELKKTGSLYAIRNVFKSPVKDNEWFTMHITVQGRRIQVKLNDLLVVTTSSRKSLSAKANTSAASSRTALSAFRDTIRIAGSVLETFMLKFCRTLPCLKIPAPSRKSTTRKKSPS